MSAVADKKRILLVEDDGPIRQIFSEILQSEGYEVSAAANGQEALDWLQQGHSVQLILLDLMMPIMDGFAFRKQQLKNSAWSQIPVVVLSADGHVREKLAEIGGSAYLRKPPDLDELLSVVARYAA